MEGFLESCKLLRFLLLVVGYCPQRRWCSLGSVIWCFYLGVHGLGIVLNMIYMCVKSPSFLDIVTIVALPDFVFSLQSFIMLCLVNVYREKMKQFCGHLSLAVHGKDAPNCEIHACTCSMCKKKSVASRFCVATILVVHIMHYVEIAYYFVTFYSAERHEEYNFKVDTIGRFGTVASSVAYIFQSIPHYTFQAWIMFLSVLIRKLLRNFNHDVKLVFSRPTTIPEHHELTARISNYKIESDECGDTDNDPDEGGKQFKEKLKNLRSTCSTLWTLINNLNDIMSNFILTYFISQGALALFFTYLLITISHQQTDPSLLVWASFHLALITTFFFVFSFIISDINEVAHDGRTHIQDMHDTAVITDSETRFQVFLLLDKLSGPDIGLSVGKFFLIDRDIIPLSVGVIMSYVVVLTTEVPQ